MVDGTEDLPERQDAIDAAAASVGSLTRKIIDLGDDAGAADALYEAIVEWATETKNVELYDAQDEAVMELCEGNNVLLTTPTGSGKTLVATAAIAAATARGDAAWYTAPLKALVTEKFFQLVGDFGAKNVGLLTGDASVNPTAPIICCTAEVLANAALRRGRELDCGLIVADEFHYYGDRDRGWAWQVPMVELPDAQARSGYHAGPHTTAFARCTPILKDFLSRRSSLRPSPRVSSIPTHLDAFQLRF